MVILCLVRWRKLGGCGWIRDFAFGWTNLGFHLDIFTSRYHVPRRPRASPTISGNPVHLYLRTRTEARGQQHILRLLNTNVDGKRKVMYALTEIKGVGRRYSNIVCKKADVDLNKRCVVPEVRSWDL